MRYFIFFLLVFISGCGNPNPIISPETSELPDAVVNKKYQETVYIQEGAVNESTVSVTITPADSGLMWRPEETRYQFAGEENINKDYHHIIIYGTPQKTGAYNVTVSGFTLGTMYPGRDFYKKYNLNVK